jgi:hypothetical protein
LQRVTIKRPAQGGGQRKDLNWEGTMKKLILDLDALKVESFEADENSGQRGTVLGAEFTGPDACITHTCGDSVRVACMD